MDRTSEILEGTISFPQQILGFLDPTEDEKLLIDQFWNAVTSNYLSENTTDTIRWYDKFDNPQLFNSLLAHLTMAQWIEVHVDMNYSSIELLDSKLLKWVTQDQLIEIKRKFKFNKYKLTARPATTSTLVKINHTITKTGLVREGFMKAGNHKFSYDLKYLNQYTTDIAWNINKGMYYQTHIFGSSTKQIQYDQLCEALLDFSTHHNKEYTLNECISDSRGRAIFQCTKKVFNPISHKDARASIMIDPRPLDKDGEKHVYLFISELLGYKPKTLEEKIELGREAYEKKIMPKEDRNELDYLENSYEFIWLDRIYENLQNPKEWRVAIEIDAISSILQMMGILTNSHKYLYGTNLAVNNNQLQDLWTLPNIPRLLVKKAMTPILYGSNAEITTIWDNLGYAYTPEHEEILLKELVFGRFKEAQDFKDFIIRHCNPQATEFVHIFNDKFEVHCNKFRWELDETVIYNVYSVNRLKQITRSVQRVPDLKRFKLYHVTLLCHNLDSQVANYISHNMDYVLPNHDAFILHPNDASLCKDLYVDYMTQIYQNRHNILKTFFKCIGIKEEFKDIDTEELELCGNALK